MGAAHSRKSAKRICMRQAITLLQYIFREGYFPKEWCAG
jgi:hypothetical protein